MSLLLLPFLFFLLLIAVASIASRSARRRREVEEEERRQAELAQGGAPAEISPFGLFPFGGILGDLIGGPGSWSRSYTYDEATGQWVDISELAPEPAPEAEDAEAAPQARNGERRRARPRPRRRPQQAQNPLAGPPGRRDDGRR
ncbi:MAG: hypothetical protein H0U90_09985 [Actinobacteria bacterium]|nr:hypothetical protein [Actinomycetota bacterium]